MFNRKKDSVFLSSKHRENESTTGVAGTLKYINLETYLFGTTRDQFIVKVATDVKEASQLTEVGFDYLTDEYNDGGKLFRKRK